MHRVLANGQVDGYTAEFDGWTDRRVTSTSASARSARSSRSSRSTLVTTETTEQMRAERAIATQARMIESMLEGVAVDQRAGVIEITNPAFDTLFGYRRGELIGRDMTTLAGWPFEQPERWQQLRGRAGRRSMQRGIRRRRADGSHFAAAGVLSRFEVAGRNHSLLVLAGRQRAQATGARDPAGREPRAVSHRQRSARRPRVRS